MTVQDPNVVATSGAESAAVDSPAAGQLGLSVRTPADGVAVVSVSGEVDMLTAPQLRAEALRHLDGRTLVLDLSGVTFLGSAGLAVLVEASQQAKARDAEFRVVAVDRAVTRPLVATGLGDVFSVSASVEEALAGGSR
ncbi:STAS domain-containing protein [Actinosynnema sp. NPDC053489]|uniref:STAS domain-containing protein n=1 Tax=Actinosynnema sp. NPDC053489 TaxID=3363916 RepID=UPI0037C8AD87